MRSPRLCERQEVKAKTSAEAEVRVPYGTRAKKETLGLLTIILLVSDNLRKSMNITTTLSMKCIYSPTFWT